MIYAFGDYTLDEDRHELCRAGQVVAIEPKVLQVLLYLLQHRDRVVTKDDLFAHCWSETFVSEAALTRCLAKVRQVVQPGRSGAPIIKTVHRQGYRFMAAVTTHTDKTPPDHAAAPPPPAVRQEPLPAASLAVPEGPVPLAQHADAAPASALAPRRPAAERRQLTVLSCSLADTPLLASELDPEDLHAVVHSLHALCTEVIQRFAGHIAQYRRDGLLVYFGYPQAQENDAERAVRAGLGIVAGMPALTTRLAPYAGGRVAVQIGIHTGPVIMGAMGSSDRQDHVALGETPQIAEDLEALAAPDTVVISAATARLVEGYFVWQALERQQLPGVPSPLAGYRVLYESGAQTRLEVVAVRGLTPLVGREQDVRLLVERWEQVQAGDGQVVLLSGEAGIGKSRVVEALKDHAAHTAYTQIVFRCSPYHQYSAFYPVIIHLQRVLRLHRDDPPAVQLDKLEHGVQAARLRLDEVVPLFAALLSMPVPERYTPLHWSPQQQKQKTEEALVAWLLAEAERQPVLAVWEDLHWADPSSLEFVGLCIEQAPMARLFLLLTCRPVFRPPWPPRSYLTHLTLGHLRRNQMAQIVVHLTGGKTLPATVLDHVLTKTDGVPLFVEEITKTVPESGLLQAREDRYELTGSMSMLAIPTTLHDALIARLDRLGAAKGVAQLGATIGRQFAYELLQAVSPLDEAALQHELGRLMEAELLYQRGVPPHATYTFKHALIQDAAYHSLLKRTQQQYHRRIAQVLEAQFPETAVIQPELVAQHYTEAGCTEQAIPYWQRAGQQALQRSANPEAVQHLTKGLDLLATLPETLTRVEQELDLQLDLGPALMATKGQAAPEVEQTYARARVLCAQVGETPKIFPTVWGLWRFYNGRGGRALPTAWELGEQLMQLAQRAADPTYRLEAHEALGQTLFHLGDYATARTHLEQGIALTDPMTQRALAQALDHPYSLAMAQFWVAILHHHRRDATAVQTQAEALLSLATIQGFPLHVGNGTYLRGWVLAMQGEGTAGLAQLHQGLATVLATGQERSRPKCWLLLAEAAGHVGEVEEGLRLLAEALTALDASGQGDLLAEAYRLQGEFLPRQAAPDAVQAEACFQQALAIARRQQAKSWELRAATSLARLWQRQGKRAEARELLAPIYGWFSEGFDTADLQDAKALLAELV